MREYRTSGSVRGVPGNGHSYRGAERSLAGLRKRLLSLVRYTEGRLGASCFLLKPACLYPPTGLDRRIF
jgi:hypothetical protein